MEKSPKDLLPIGMQPHSQAPSPIGFAYARIIIASCRAKIPLLLEGVPGGGGSDAIITAKLYIVGEGGVAPNGWPKGGVVTQVLRRSRNM